MAWHIFFNFLLGTLAIIGLAAIVCAIITLVILTRDGDVPDDDRHRQEDEEQLEYLRKWRETHDRR